MIFQITVNLLKINFQNFRHQQTLLIVVTVISPVQVFMIFTQRSYANTCIGISDKVPGVTLLLSVQLFVLFT